MPDEDEIQDPVENTEQDPESDSAQPGDPHWVQKRLDKYKGQRDRERDGRIKAEAEASAYRAQLESVSASSSGRSEKPAELPKEGIAAFPDTELVSYVTEYDGAMQALALDPSNEEAKALLGKRRPEQVLAVRREIQKRDAAEQVASLRGDLGRQSEATRAQAALQNKMRLKFGDEVMNPASELMQAAVGEFRELAKELGTDQDTNGAMSMIALERATAKLKRNSRDGRGISDGDRRRLGVEGQARREASPSNAITALEARGDWKSKRDAQSMKLEGFLTQMYGS